MSAPVIDLEPEKNIGFKCVDDNNPRGKYLRQRNQADFEFWMSQKPSADTDFESYVTTLSGQLGISLPRVRAIVACFQRLMMLPLLVALQRELYHLDLDRLISIDRALKGVDEDKMPEVDAYLKKLLTPVVPDEVLRQPQAISTRITRQLTVIDPEAVRQRQQEKRGVTTTHEDLNTRVSMRMTPDEAIEVNSIIKKVSKKEGISDIDAALEIFRGRADTKVVLNLVPNEVGLLDLVGAGPLSQQQVETWLPRVTHARILHYDMAKDNGKRFFGQGSQAFLDCRDGHCDSPGCTTDAKHCDGEHTINFDGGNTDPGNGGKVCPPCHKAKTDNRIGMHSVNRKGVKTWVDGDGETYTTLPDGPLAHTGDQLATPEEVIATQRAVEPPTPNTKGWGQSLEQKVNKQRSDRRKKNLRIVED